MAQLWKKNGIIFRLFMIGLLLVAVQYGKHLYISNIYNPRLLSAVVHDDAPAAHAALAAGADPNTRYGSGIPFCLEYFDTSTANSSLPTRETNKFTVLMEAANRGQVEIVANLLEHGAVVDACDNRGNTALSWALKMNLATFSRQRRSAIIKMLVRHGALIRHEDLYWPENR